MSGAWTYARELVTGLVTRGARVTLVTFGEIPLPDQTVWMDNLHGLDYRPTAFRLEWMQEAEQDLPESSNFLIDLVREVQPDVLHLNQFCYGNLPVDVPRVVMAHGDLISWTQAVHGHGPRPTRWLKWYRDTVIRGIAGADALVAPSAWMLDTLRSCYTRSRRDVVIYPGRNPIFFNPYISKDDSVLAVGRLIDAGRQVFLLTQHVHPLSVCIVGSEQTVAVPRSRAAPSSPMIFPASARSGATPLSISKPMMPIVLPMPSAFSMPTVKCAALMPTSPTLAPAIVSPPS